MKKKISALLVSLFFAVGASAQSVKVICADGADAQDANQRMNSDDPNPDLNDFDGKIVSIGGTSVTVLPSGRVMVCVAILHN